jgi:hypothetical protein
MDLEQLLSIWSQLDEGERGAVIAAGVLPPAAAALLEGIFREMDRRALLTPPGTPPELPAAPSTPSAPSPSSVPAPSSPGGQGFWDARTPRTPPVSSGRTAGGGRPLIQPSPDLLYPLPASSRPSGTMLGGSPQSMLDRFGQSMTGLDMPPSGMSGPSGTMVSGRPPGMTLPGMPPSGMTGPSGTMLGGPPRGPGGTMFDALPPTGPSGTMMSGRPSGMFGPSGTMLGGPPRGPGGTMVDALPPTGPSGTGLSYPRGPTHIPGTSPGVSPSVMRMAGMHTQVPEPMTMPLRDVSPQSYLGRATDPFEAIGARQRAVGGLEAPRIPTPGGPPRGPSGTMPGGPPTGPSGTMFGGPPRGPNGTMVDALLPTGSSGRPPSTPPMARPTPGPSGTPPSGLTRLVSTPSAGPSALRRLAGSAGRIANVAGPAITAGMAMAHAGAADPGEEGGVIKSMLRRDPWTPLAQNDAADSKKGEEGIGIRDLLPVETIMPGGTGWGMKAVNMALDSGMYDRPAQALGELAGGAGRFLERATRGGPFDFVSGTKPSPSFDSEPPSALAAPFSPSAPSAPAASAAPSPSAPAKGGPSAKVAALQRRMKEAGFDPGEIDGIWGPNTQKAYAAYKARGSGMAPAGPTEYGPPPRDMEAASGFRNPWLMAPRGPRGL